MLVHNCQIDRIEDHLRNTLWRVSVTSFLERFNWSLKTFYVRLHPIAELPGRLESKLSTFHYSWYPKCRYCIAIMSSYHNFPSMIYLSSGAKIKPLLHFSLFRCQWVFNERMILWVKVSLSVELHMVHSKLQENWGHFTDFFRRSQFFQWY